MEPVKYKQRVIQKSYPKLTQTPLGNSEPVTEAYKAHPVIDRDAALRFKTSSSYNNANPQPITPRSRPLAAQPAAQPVNAAPKQVRLPAIDMELPGDASPSRIADMLDSARARRARRWAFRGVALSLVLVITMGGLLVSQTYSKANKMFRGSAGTANALKSNVDPDMLRGESSGRINVLLLGRGGGNHNAPDLTDTIMLASIDPINHTSTLVSIPRDLWVTVQGRGVMKLNAAWQTGRNDYMLSNKVKANNPKAMDAGFKLLDQTVEEVVGVNIDYNVIVNFQAFKQAIDTVGGVNVNVPEDLVDPTMAWENANNPVLAKAGPQAFDGTRSLIYVRSRETSSDFARSQRQRTVMLALKDKIDTVGTLSNPMKISGLIKAFGDNIYTDLSMQNATRLYTIVKKVSDMNTKTIGLTDAANPLLTTGNVNGQSVVLPKAGLFKYDDIKNLMKVELKNPYLIKENAKILVLNGTPKEGLATLKSDSLKKLGYNVVGSANTPASGYTQTLLIDVHSGKKKFTKKLLEQNLGIQAMTSMPDDTIPTNNADFVIILGSNEAITSKTQTN